jgi:glycosyltransferase involved in cell wall biosynthesis
MKILLLNYEFPPLGGGASPVSFEIARGLATLGHEIDVVTMGYKGLPALEEKDGMRIHRIPCIRSKVEICHPWELLSYIISGWFFLRRHLKKNRYDVCHCHFIIPTGPLAWWVKRRFGLEYIITSHGSDVLGHNNRFRLLYPLLKWPWGLIVRGASLVVSPSSYLSDRIGELEPSSRRQVIPNGIEAGKFPPMKKQNYILCVTRLFYNKGVQDLLEAVKGRDLGGWHVKIVGDGPHRDALHELHRELRLGKNVEFSGWVDNTSDRMKELYGHARIFVSTSYFESFGLTVLEALSAGCYPILSDIPGHRYIIGDDRHFFTKGDPVSLRERLQTAMKSRALKHAVDIRPFLWENVIKAYEKALGGR